MKLCRCFPSGLPLPALTSDLRGPEAAMPMPQNITKAQEEARLGIFRWGWTAQSGQTHHWFLMVCHTCRPCLECECGKGQGTASQNPPDPVKSETVHQGSAMSTSTAWIAW